VIAEGDSKCLVQAGASGLGGAHIRAYRDVHADEARKSRQDGTQREAARGCAIQKDPDDHEQDRADDADRRVLSIEICLRPGLNGGGDFLHAGIAGGLGQDPGDRPGTVYQCGSRADEREDECV
jgi:hypothetical protein